MADPRTGGGDDNAKYWLWAVAAVLGAFIIIPAVIAVAIWWFGRRTLARRDWIILGCGSLLGLLVGGGGLWSRYVNWLGVLVFGGDRWPPPVLSLALLAGLIVGVLGVIDGTAVGAKLPAVLLGQSGRVGDREEIIPSDVEKAQVGAITPTVLTPEVDSIADDAAHVPLGKRVVPLGVGKDGAPVGPTLDELGTHGLLFGSTGSGKTETIKALAGGLMDLGVGGIILDLKEDTQEGGLRDWCVTYAQTHAVPYQELLLSSLDSEYWFNPFLGMRMDEAKDAVLSLMTFDDEHWKNINKKLLGQILKLMYWAHEIDPAAIPAPTLGEVGRILSSTNLATATKKLRAVVAANRPDLDCDEEFSALARPSPDEAKSAVGFGAKITQMFDTTAGRLTLRANNPDGVARRPLDVTQPGLTYIGLDTQGKPDLTKIVSSAVLQRLSVESAQRTTGAAAARGDGPPKQRFLIIDEANWIDRTIVQNLLSRARSAGISMVLATQGPLDWIDGAQDDFAKLSQNTNVAMIMAQGEPKAAEKCAEYLGKERYMDTSFRHVEGALVDGGSVTERTDYIVQPDALRQMEVGEMVLRVGKPRTRLAWLRVVRRDPTTGPNTPQTASKRRSTHRGRAVGGPRIAKPGSSS